MKYFANIANKAYNKKQAFITKHWVGNDTSVRNIFKSSRITQTININKINITAWNFLLTYNAVLTGYQLDFLQRPVDIQEVVELKASRECVKRGTIVLFNNLHAYKEIIKYISDPYLRAEVIDNQEIDKIWLKLNHLSIQEVSDIFQTIILIRFFIHMNNRVNIFLPHNMYSIYHLVLYKHEIKISNLFRQTFDTRKFIKAWITKMNFKIDMKHDFILKLLGIVNQANSTLINWDKYTLPTPVVAQSGGLIPRVYNKIFFGLDEHKYTMNQILGTTGPTDGVIFNATMITIATNKFWMEVIEPIFAKGLNSHVTIAMKIKSVYGNYRNIGKYWAYKPGEMKLFTQTLLAWWFANDKEQYNSEQFELEAILFSYKALTEKDSLLKIRSPEVRQMPNNMFKMFSHEYTNFPAVWDLLTIEGLTKHMSKYDNSEYFIKG